MVTMYSTDRFDDEPSDTSYHTDDFELEDNPEVILSSDESDDDNRGNNNNDTIHQTMFMTMDNNELFGINLDQRVIIDSGADSHVGGVIGYP